MTFSESALEELGLAPMWVRRGMRPSVETTASVDAASTASTIEASDAAGTTLLLQDTSPREAGMNTRIQQPPADAAEPAWLDDVSAEPPVHSRTNRIVVDAQADTSTSVATLDWDTLSARVAACERCRLCEKRTNTVFGVGDRNADWSNVEQQLELVHPVPEIAIQSLNLRLRFSAFCDIHHHAAQPCRCAVLVRKHFNNVAQPHDPAIGRDGRVLEIV